MDWSMEQHSQHPSFITQSGTGIHNRLSINAASVLIWDKIIMSHRHCVKAESRSLKELRDNTLPFGGLIMILGGDFRQTLPIVPGGGALQLNKPLPC
ncbi:hypothetical protein PCANC_11501 [Puccinia coronata f. sp. avenae]|uniref:ATP-dependent DNA helicase n=1 Tax=Puccinia coronata f. sp. avenae TaxID=200324 RepID=A0A2N5UVM4_9BASI|nr:hypothetical protein PCANC_11501 [Puccinia coronata f. sp. avenae]